MYSQHYAKARFWPNSSTCEEVLDRLPQILSHMAFMVAKLAASLKGSSIDKILGKGLRCKVNTTLGSRGLRLEVYYGQAEDSTQGSYQKLEI